MKSFITVFLLFPIVAFGQSNYAPLNDDYYHWIDRYEIKTGRIFPQIFTSIRPYKRSAIVQFTDSAKSMNVIGSRSDQFNYEYLMNDNWEWSQAATSDSKTPILKHFYKKKSDFFHVHNDDLDLHVNPVIYFGLGQDSRRADRLFINTRGIEVRGMIDKTVGFY